MTPKNKYNIAPGPMTRMDQSKYRVAPGPMTAVNQKSQFYSAGPTGMQNPAKQQFVQNLVTPRSEYVNTNASFNNNVTTNTPTSAPTRPAVDPRRGYTDAFNAYIRSLMPTDEEITAQNRLNQLITGNKEAYEKALRSGETLEYSTGLAGQQSRNAAIQEDAAARSLEALTGRRQALSDAQRARLEFESSMLQKEPKGFELSEGQTRYEFDPTTGSYKEIATRPRTFSSSSSSFGSSGGVSGVTNSVMKNPALYNTLTPTLKGQVLRELSASGFDTTKLTAPQLNPGQREQIAGFDDLLREAGNISTALGGGINTGPIASRVQMGQALLGFAPDFTNLRSMIDNMASQLLRLRSGAAVTPQEYERIKGFIPRPTDDEKTIAIKTARFIEETNAAKNAFVNRATQSTQQIVDSAIPQAGSVEYEDYLAVINQ